MFQTLVSPKGEYGLPLSLCEEEWGMKPFLKVNSSEKRNAIDRLSNKKMWKKLANDYGIFKVPYEPSLGKDRIDCSVYVFEVVYREPWRHLMYNTSAATDFNNHPINYLDSIGYRLTYHPAKWDIIAYVGREYGKKTRLMHFGILEAQNETISKWGRNELMRHELFDVPPDYGNEIIFFRHEAKEPIHKATLDHS